MTCESPHSRAWQARLSRLRRLLRTATVRVVEAASRRPAGMRRPAVSWAAVAPVQDPPRSGPRSYPDAAMLTASLTSGACVARPSGPSGSAEWVAGWPPSPRFPVSGSSPPLPSPAEADPSRSQVGVRCLVPSCLLPWQHCGP